LLVTPEDLNPESLFPVSSCFAGGLVLTDAGSGGPLSRAFVAGAATDAGARVADCFACPVQRVDSLDPEQLRALAAIAGADTIVTAAAPVGPVASQLAQASRSLAQTGVTLAQVPRSWDARFWPHARKGFFAFKDMIPRILAQEGLS
jgi:deoxyribodipyrimidine photo-lyase